MSVRRLVASLRTDRHARTVGPPRMGSRMVTVLIAMESCLELEGRPPSRAEIIDEIQGLDPDGAQWADTSAVGRVLRLLVRAGYVTDAGSGHYVMGRSMTRGAVNYLATFDGD